MLILSRKQGETVHIGERITVRVLSTQRGQVRLGFDAPKSIPIHRQEIYWRRQQDAVSRAEEALQDWHLEDESC